MESDEKFNMAYDKLVRVEGGYTNGKNQVDDEPTNMGIKQSTLEKYLRNNPTKHFPSDVRDLTASQVKEIYKNQYWDNTNIGKINNDRIRNAVFDMGVMSGPVISTKTLQQTLNEVFWEMLPVTGYLGKQTIWVINSIPENRVDDFMMVLVKNRLQSLRKMTNWPTACVGWTVRTQAY